MPRTTTCTHHCAACGLHFHSLEAFDTHRIGGFRSDNPASARRCHHPLDLGGTLLPLTVDGQCRLSHDAYGVDMKRQATIWATARQLGSRPWEAAQSVHVRLSERHAEVVVSRMRPRVAQDAQEQSAHLILERAWRYLAPDGGGSRDEDVSGVR